jgi:UDP-3-O-[3-hydroxymyristoyl] glucosamine N-acyltransferase
MKKKVIQGVTLSTQQVVEIVNGNGGGASDRVARVMCSFDELIQGKSDAISFSTQKSSDKLGKTLADAPPTILLTQKSIDHSRLPAHSFYIAVADPLRSFIELVPHFYTEYASTPSIHPTAVVHESAKIGSHVSVGPYVTIAENCVIGDRVVLYPHVCLYPEVTVGDDSILHSHATVRERCVLGKGVIIQNGSVVGGDGFGYIPDPTLGIKAVPQVGSVILGDRVEIGVNSCVDRGAFSNTTIGMGTKIDNHVQIGHNCTIGRFSILCGHVALAGGTHIGNQVTFAGGAKSTGHHSVCDHARIAGNGVTTSDITEAGDYGGYPAQPLKTWKRELAALRKLPALINRLREHGLLNEDPTSERDA